MRLALIFAAIFAVMALEGCAFGGGVQQMTPEQIRATAGMATCTEAVTMYGKGASITANTDEVRKGATSKGKVTITCGSSTMTIETDVGVAPPAVTTTTTTVTPAKP